MSHLILSPNEGATIELEGAGNVKIKILKTRKSRVTLSIDAPRSVGVTHHKAAKPSLVEGDDADKG